VANNVQPYDHIWYAQRALERLEKALGITKTVYMGYHEEPKKVGSVIEIRKPGSVPVQAMPITTATDLTPQKTTIVLDQWWGNAIQVTDKELTFGGEQLVNEHIAPMMQSLAEKIESTLVDLILECPWKVANMGAAAIADLVALRKTMNDNYVPKGARYLAVNTEREAGFLSIPQFINADQNADGAAAQRDGMLTRKFGLDIFQSDMLVNSAAGTLVVTGTAALVGAHALGATAVTFNGSTSAVGTLKRGDSFKIAGNNQKYAVTDATATAAGNSITVNISPELKQAYAGGSVVTLDTLTSAGESFAYDRQYMAIVMAPLAEDGNGKGVEIATVNDPRTGLTLRVRRWYEPKEAANYLSFDALWGKKVLDANRGVRLQGPLT
jgi:hypothetical protein